MSGGRLDYKPDECMNAVFNYILSSRQDWAEQSRLAVRMNPLRDKELSELTYDLLRLLHDFEWMESGDTCEDTYYKTVETFKGKWFREARDDRMKRYIDDSIEDLKNEMYRLIGGSYHENA